MGGPCRPARRRGSGRLCRRSGRRPAHFSPQAAARRHLLGAAASPRGRSLEEQRHLLGVAGRAPVSAVPPRPSTVPHAALSGRQFGGQFGVATKAGLPGGQALAPIPQKR